MENRIPINISGGGFDRYDATVKAPVDFSNILTNLGYNGQNNIVDPGV